MTVADSERAAELAKLETITAAFRSAMHMGSDSADIKTSAKRTEEEAFAKANKCEGDAIVRTAEATAALPLAVAPMLSAEVRVRHLDPARSHTHPSDAPAE